MNPEEPLQPFKVDWGRGSFPNMSEIIYFHGSSRSSLGQMFISSTIVWSRFLFAPPVAEAKFACSFVLPPGYGCAFFAGALLVGLNRKLKGRQHFRLDTLRQDTPLGGSVPSPAVFLFGLFQFTDKLFLLFRGSENAQPNPHASGEHRRLLEAEGV